jgi:hypothetical protein
MANATNASIRPVLFALSTKDRLTLPRQAPDASDRRRPAVLGGMIGGGSILGESRSCPAWDGASSWR